MKGASPIRCAFVIIVLWQQGTLYAFGWLDVIYMQVNRSSNSFSHFCLFVPFLLMLRAWSQTPIYPTKLDRRTPSLWPLLHPSPPLSLSPSSHLPFRTQRTLIRLLMEIKHPRSMYLRKWIKLESAVQPSRYMWRQNHLTTIHNMLRLVSCLFQRRLFVFFFFYFRIFVGFARRPLKSFGAVIYCGLFWYTSYSQRAHFFFKLYANQNHKKI